MKRPPLEILSLKGTAVEIAHQLGKRRAKKIARRVEYWNHHLEIVFKGKRVLQRSLESRFLHEVKQQANSYLEEIRAMAEGAGLPFLELFRLNLTELSTFVDKCTDLILPVETREGRKILIAHNEDWDPKRNDVFILKAQLFDQSYIILAFDGYLPGLSAGMNSHGLCHSVNYLQPTDFRQGLPRIFVTRHLVTASNIKDCLKFIKNTRRAFGQAIHLATGKEYLGMELTARRIAFRPTALPAIHTNHYLSHKLHRDISRPTPHSLTRLKVARDLLKKNYKGKISTSPSNARRLAKKILSDRSSYPYPIWRNADHPEEISATLATVLVGTDSATVEFFRDHPSQSKSVCVSLE